MQPQPQNGNNDHMIFALVLIVLVCVGLYFGYPIYQKWNLTLKMWEMTVIAKVLPFKQNLYWLEQLQTTRLENWTSTQLSAMYRFVNLYFLPFYLWLVYFAIKHIRKHLFLIRKYIKTKNPDDAKQPAYTIHTLLKQEAYRVWRYLKPIVHENLLVNDKNPMWIRAMKPKEFVLNSSYNLLRVKDDLDTLDENRTKKVLAMQLGQVYTGLDSLPVHIKALLGIFCEHSFDSALRASEAFMKICDSFAPEAKGKHDYSAGLELFEKHRHNEQLNISMNRHAYAYTGCMDMFAFAKTKGVIITKYFLWLKPIDRKLFYALNCVGRQVSWIECAGIVDHFQNEQELQRPLLKAQVDNAYHGLKEELSNTQLTDNSLALVRSNQEVQAEIFERNYN